MTEKICWTCLHAHTDATLDPCQSCTLDLGNWEPQVTEVREPKYDFVHEVKPKDVQVGGDHYTAVIQPVDFIVKNNIKWREANVIKYVFRHEKKNGVEDLKKARHYLDMLIEDYK